MKKVFGCVILLLLFFDGMAQRPFFRELVINKVKEDLRVNAIAQSNDGLIYFGTDDGLYNYDGFSFESLHAAGDTISKKISVISSFENNKLIIGTEKGKLLLWSNNKLKSIKSPVHSPVKSIVRYENGDLWLASYGEGIYYRIGNDWHRLAGIPDPYIYQLILHPNGTLWAGTDGGLLEINPSTNPITYKIYNSGDGLPDNIVRAVGIMPDGNLLLGLQEKGICQFNTKTKKFINVTGDLNWSYGAVTSLTRLQNEFWLGTENAGIIDYEFSGDRRIRQFNNANSFPGSKVQAIMRDTEGNVWIGTDAKLVMSPGEKVEYVEAVDNFKFDSVQAIAACPEGYIWFSSPKGLFRFDYLAKDENRIVKFKVDPKLPNLHIVSLYEDDFDNLWIGTFDNGLYCLNTRSGKVRRYTEKNGLPNANVIAIAGRGTTVWLATLGGVIRCDKIIPDSGKEDDFAYSFGELGNGGEATYNGFVYCVFIDSKGRVWFGTDGKGLVMYDGFTSRSFVGQTSGKVVYSITEDLFGNIWFSTQHQGVYRFDGRNFKNYNLSHGLSELDIAGLNLDNNGNIVVVNKKGLDIINPKTFEVENIGEESGLKYIDADLNAVTRDRKGGIWIGTKTGIVRFFNYNKGVSNKPRLILKRVLSFMKQDIGLQDTVFEYNQNNISIEYTGLWFSHPDLVSYRYRMKGYSNDWIPTRDRIVTFPNLPPGKYTFEVMAGLEGQFRNASVASYHFEIVKPLWKRNWFVISIISGLALLILFYIRDRDLRLRRLEGLKKEKVEYQYATLKSQVNPHFLFNSFNTLIAIIEDDQKKAISYVEKLADYFRNMVRHRDKDVISLEEELEMVNTYYFLQQKRFGDYLELELDVPTLWKQEFGLPPLSLQLLIENAVKHNAVSYETPLKIQVTAAENHSLIISNNLNPKKQAEPSTGIGLDNIINRFTIISGQKVKVHTEGNTFIVEIPLNRIPDAY